MARKNTLAIPVFIWSVVGVLAVFLMLPRVYGLVWSKNALKNGGDAQQRVDAGSLQAVFLDNNQIYFGHLKDIDSQYPVLRDVYYIQVSETTDKKPQASNKLVKLGDIEPHRPQNEMILNKEHILFFENMRPDSPVVRAIEGQK